MWSTHAMSAGSGLYKRRVSATEAFIRKTGERGRPETQAYAQANDGFGSRFLPSAKFCGLGGGGVIS